MSEYTLVDTGHYDRKALYIDGKLAIEGETLTVEDIFKTLDLKLNCISGEDGSILFNDGFPENLLDAIIDKDEPTINLTFRYILDHCNNWDDFCSDVGLNPWIVVEGLASDSDTYSILLSLAKRHGII